MQCSRIVGRQVPLTMNIARLGKVALEIHSGECRTSTGETQYSDCRESFQTEDRGECEEVLEREFGLHDSAELAHNRLKPAHLTKRSKDMASESMTKISVLEDKGIEMNRRIGKRVNKESGREGSAGWTSVHTRMADEISDSLRRMQQEIAGINQEIASIKNFVCLMTHAEMSGQVKHALVLVLGDVGHSPRMQNHVRELGKIGFSVDFAGYAESELPEDVASQTNVVAIPPCRLNIPLLPSMVGRMVGMFIRMVFQTFYVIWLSLCTLRKPTIILVQSPPVFPTLFVGKLLSWWHGARLITDWHNVGYTLLAQTIHYPAIVALAKAVEIYSTRLSSVNLVVSQAQKEWMQINAGITTLVLYDRPNIGISKALQGADRKSFRRNIRERLGWDSEDVSLLVSSTSWTPDEDFSILVDALEILEGSLKKPIQLVVTGKGPLKTFYEEKIVHLGLRMIQFASVWLSSEDYRRLLGSADIGICMHTSSSGVDLPMKVVDMIGAELPVVAYSYTAIGELIEDGKTGVLFKTPEELAESITSLLDGKRTGTNLAIKSQHISEPSGIAGEPVFGSVLPCTGTRSTAYSNPFRLVLGSALPHTQYVLSRT
ncbi:hypothetical protein PSACC_02601 [Paramicrosporidium saccamoebae]|uniref:Chitobiosyldiphosphodolichol beta-mannosyltransferase n=1 Tax=Paramicrosporidium saccamoebae TaxID=1246581 RepID=A0A2H9TIM2_9FUNG|nr:hypothetical protein PSACC_02601 [Paramicrosporidium saccamoebae]